MPRPYFIGWYYALISLSKIIKVKRLKPKKLRYKFWKKQVQKKYFWLTTEERIEQNKKCCDELRKITWNIQLDSYYEDLDEQKGIQMPTNKLNSLTKRLSCKKLSKKKKRKYLQQINILERKEIVIL